LKHMVAETQDKKSLKHARVKFLAMLRMYNE